MKFEAISTNKNAVHRPVRSALLALPIAVACNFAVADSSNVTIYGALSAAYEGVDIGSADGNSAVANTSVNRNRVTNYGSFMGFKGAEDLGGGTKAIFQIESYVFLDGPTPPGFNPFGSRNSRVGLTGNWGTFYLGNWDTPFRILLGKNLFPGSVQDSSQLLGNTVANSVGNTSATASFARRQGNAVVYQTPEMKGWQATLMHSMNEEKTAVINPSLWSAGVFYDTAPYSLAAAYESHKDYGGAGTTDSGVGLYAAYRFGNAQLDALYTHLKYERLVGASVLDLEQNNWQIEGSYRMGANRIKLAYTRAGNGSGGLKALGINGSGQNTINTGLMVGQATVGSDTGAEMITLGYDYSMSKRSKLLASMMWLNNDSRGSYTPATITHTSGALGVDTKVLSLGMLHFF